MNNITANQDNYTWSRQLIRAEELILWVLSFTTTKCDCCDYLHHSYFVNAEKCNHIYTAYKPIIQHKCLKHASFKGHQGQILWFKKTGYIEVCEVNNLTGSLVCVYLSFSISSTPHFGTSYDGGHFHLLYTVYGCNLCFFKASQLSHAIQPKKFSSKTTFLIFMLHADVCENSNKK